MTENDPAQITTTASSERCARVVTPLVNAAGAGHREMATHGAAQYFLEHAGEPRRIRCRVGRRHLHAGPGHRPHHQEHARRRTPWRDRDGGRRGDRPGDLDDRRERRGGGAPERVRAGVSRSQARGRRVPRLPRRPVALRRDSSSRTHSRASAKRTDPPVPRVSAGSPQQPRQPEDGGVLRQPASAVRTRGSRLVRRAARIRLALLRADARLADVVRSCRRSRPSPSRRSCPTSARRLDRSRSRRLRRARWRSPSARCSISERARSGARLRGAPCSSSPLQPDHPRRARRRRSGSRGRRGS